MLAHLLSHYNLQTVLLEAGPDICNGASRANSGIVHAGFAAHPGTLMARFNVAGNRAFDALSETLKFPFQRIGSLVCAQSLEDLPRLEQLREQGRQNGVTGLEIWDQDRLSQEEPNVNAVAALFAPTGGIVSPYEMTYALCESAKANGVLILTNHPVTRADLGAPHVLYAGDTSITCDVVINAAGLYSDDVAALAGDSYTVTARKGEYLLLDRFEGTLVHHTLFPLPTPTSKGILVSPTVDGNLLLGPTATPTEKGDKSTTPEGLQQVLTRATSMVRGITRPQIITNFAGLRAVAGDDFIIEPSRTPNWINLVGIQSPGLTAAPAIAEYVVAMLSDHTTLKLIPKEWKAPSRAIEHDDRVICRCESVGKAEIQAAIEEGATSLDAIKLRCRAGAGRCQGSTCRAQVTKILAESQGIPLEEVTKRGDGSWLLAGPIDKGVR